MVHPFAGPAEEGPAPADASHAGEGGAGLEASSDGLLHERQGSSGVSEDSNGLPEVVVEDASRSVEDSTAQHMTQQLATAMGVYSLTNMQSFWDWKLDTKALLAWNRGMVVLAFCGTQSLANAWSDIKVCLCLCAAASHHPMAAMPRVWLRGSLHVRCAIPMHLICNTHMLKSFAGARKLQEGAIQLRVVFHASNSSMHAGVANNASPEFSSVIPARHTQEPRTRTYRILSCMDICPHPWAGP